MNKIIPSFESERNKIIFFFPTGLTDVGDRDLASFVTKYHMESAPDGRSVNREEMGGATFFLLPFLSF